MRTFDFLQVITGGRRRQTWLGCAGRVRSDAIRWKVVQQHYCLVPCGEARNAIKKYDATSFSFFFLLIPFVIFALFLSDST